jgi:hypothetical protein
MIQLGARYDAVMALDHPDYVYTGHLYLPATDENIMMALNSWYQYGWDEGFVFYHRCYWVRSREDVQEALVPYDDVSAYEDPESLQVIGGGREDSTCRLIRYRRFQMLP